MTEIQSSKRVLGVLMPKPDDPTSRRVRRNIMEGGEGGGSYTPTI